MFGNTAPTPSTDAEPEAVPTEAAVALLIPSILEEPAALAIAKYLEIAIAVAAEVPKTVPMLGKLFDPSTVAVPAIDPTALNVEAAIPFAVEVFVEVPILAVVEIALVDEVPAIKPTAKIPVESADIGFSDSA